MEYLDNHFSVLVKHGATFATAEDVITQFKTDCVSDEISEIMEFNETLLAEGKVTETVSLMDGGIKIERTYTDAEDVTRVWDLDKNSKRKTEKIIRVAGWHVPFKI
jgi:urease gamma subunit|tara:strand:- start:554 stop:871 length:318 start_codon:yes stop_codon:yes gene_type:complete